ncbi:hypothetical protein GCM10011495_16430 [Hymenobacter frigidus]|uniref:Uncharacterized protein n=1 Tax=Hymenobacter frigidus TaxID=1524095 RepID=A0ABQ2A5K0_9BACT|nr:hypothetical protein [Hymenobacter frigidus]GGH84461.1 hypothetical protein GCM10011495_16430 [Hymenobacter frigidus]
MPPRPILPRHPSRRCPYRQRLVPMLLLLLLLTAYFANAQRYVQYALGTAQVFSYVEQMPTLPGREGPTAVQAALQELITNPKRAD